VPVVQLLESQLLPQPADVPVAVPGILPKSRWDMPVEPDRLPLGHGWDWPILRSTHWQRYHRKELSLSGCGCGRLSRIGSRPVASFPHHGEAGKSGEDAAHLVRGRTGRGLATKLSSIDPVLASNPPGQADLTMAGSAARSPLAR